ncbi:McrC family protein [Planctellipticum variicoloris]|uniref:McrC family protein n=1 Tax=Planctellipticum variicoloris TaxID=3064265 RepID=UPI003013FE8B|nr:McrC family protein [Planctomycetaceae bacterium SH412]
MLEIRLTEFDRLPRKRLTLRQLRELQRFDELQGRSTGDTVFDWTFRDHIRVKSYVGVIQVPGLIIEILPKTDGGEDSTGFGDGGQARQNLLFMLSQAGYLPGHDRDLASLAGRRLPLLEVLITAFVRRLLIEVRRGQQHQYVYREESLSCVKGRILLQRQVLQNVAQRHRLWVGYDEFVNDTLLNQILKATCRCLLALARLPKTQQLLREALLEFADVEDLVIQGDDFSRVLLDRASERYRDLLQFCRLVYEGTTVAPQAGAHSSFSLFFPMETLFEEFVGRFVKRNARYFGLLPEQVHLQARGRGLWLLRDENLQGRFRLRPDIVIDDVAGVPQIILDTKWKRLVDLKSDAKNGVSQADLYQLFAYASRYNCENNVLLYPHSPGVVSRSYSIDGDPSKKRLRIECLDLGFDLYLERDRLLNNLAAILNPTSSSEPVVEG